MAEATVQVLVEKLIAVAAEEIGLIFGVKKELTSLKESFEIIRAFLHDASRRQVEEEAVKLWLKNLERIAYEAEELLDEFNYEIIRRKVEIRNQMKRKVCFFFCFTNRLLFRSRMAHKIKDVNMKLEKANRDANTYGFQSRVANSALSLPSVIETDHLSVDPIFLGRENDISMMVNMLVNPNDEVVSVIPIIGMGGLGKTTLARKIFNDQQIEKHFSAKAWVCVSENSGTTTRLFKRILESLTNNIVQVEERGAILENIKGKLKDGKYLLVLDDLWNEERTYWEKFKNSLVGISSNKGNFIIVTSRSEVVASIVNPMYKHNLDKLSGADCWKIIKNRAFPNEEEVSKDLETIGRKIANRCGGLPLAASMIGGSLQGKGMDDWASVLQSGLLDSTGDTNGVMQILKVSYDRLPSSLLKKCFAYCSIFSEDKKIEKERLIQLWMAEGFLVENDRDDMESLGSKVYDILLQNSFLQEAVKDSYGNIILSKMHDLVHDLSCSISKEESLNVENRNTDSIVGQVKYLATKSLDKESHKMAKEDLIYLRALFLGGIDMIPDSVFSNCRNLHTLDLEGANIKELTVSITMLIHLRFLDVSYTMIRAFPGSICKLYNLQTLRADRCYNLEKLPDQLQNLVSLRHLIIDANLQLPLKIGKLTCLRTLKFFKVGSECGYGIEELGYLKNLKGELAIQNLECVNYREEAARARLNEKPNIHELTLAWSKRREGNNNLTDEQVLEGLEPHSNIKGLTISGFLGDNFPSWFMNRTIGVTRLENLIELKLIDCERCLEIPTLGHLPRLKVLELRGLENVTSIGPWFYGNESSRRNNNQPPFPALDRFILEDMANLKESTEMSTDNASKVVNGAFPHLELLQIRRCPNMSSIPSHGFPSLKVLSINDVERGGVLLDKICSNPLSSLMSLSLTNVSEVTCFPERLLYGNQRLRSLIISKCPSLTNTELSGQSLQSIEDIFISACDKLKSIQFSTGDNSLRSLQKFRVRGCTELTDISSTMLETCTSIENMEITKCDNMVSLDRLRMPSCLSRLNISVCSKLRSLPKGGLNCLSYVGQLRIGPFSEEMGFASFCEIFQGIQRLHSLTTLTLYGWPHFDSLPDQFQHLTTLTYFELFDFGIETLPEWFGNLSSLQHLFFARCKRLRHLPSKEAILRLTKFSHIYILECPVLKERCKPDQSEWYKISHIRIIGEVCERNRVADRLANMACGTRENKFFG